jgi:exosortase
VWWKVLLTTITLALRSDRYTHILLIVPISALLIVLQWRNGTWRPIANPRAGSIVLVGALLIALAGLRGGSQGVAAADLQVAIEMLAVVVWWIGSFLFCFGASAFRECTFPLLFLLCSIPLPEFVLNGMVEFLQQSTVLCARGIFTLAGVPVKQHGTALTIPGLTVEVAQECSSIRSSTMLIVTSMAMSYLLLRSFWSRTIVILIALPLSIIKNGVRVFTLATLAAYVDPGILNSPLHHQGGVLFLALGLAGMFVVIWIARKFERRAGGLRATAQLPYVSTLSSSSWR